MTLGLCKLLSERKTSLDLELNLQQAHASAAEAMMLQLVSQHDTEQSCLCCVSKLEITLPQVGWWPLSMGALWGFAVFWLQDMWVRFVGTISQYLGITVS